MGRDQAAMINIPERFTQFLLEDDEKKVTFEVDTRESLPATFLYVLPSANIFSFHRRR
jgi:hypothetical protein